MRSEDTPSNYFRNDQQPRPVVLATQGKGFFDIAYGAVPNEAIGETVCPSATRMRVTAPGDTAAILMDMEIQPCGQRLRVSPVRDVAEPEVQVTVAPPSSAA